MSSEAIIPVLLIVCFLVSLIMAAVARQEVPGSGEYRADTAPADPLAAFWARISGNASMHPGFRAGDGLGRDAPSPRHRHGAESGLGRGQGYARGHSAGGGSEYGAAARRRYHANGSAGHGQRDPYEDAADNGFEAWARSQGYRWAGDPEPPPPPEPKVPHWSAVLGVERTAGAKEIRKAYAGIMRGLHPDKVAQDAFTSQRCADVNAAYDAARKDAQKAGRA